MATDAQQPAPSGPKGWWSTIVWSKTALMLTLALPAVVVATEVFLPSSSDLLDPDWLVPLLLAFPVIAILCGFMARAREGTRSARIVGCVVIVYSSLQIAAVLLVVVMMSRHTPRTVKSEDNLRQLFAFMNIYAQYHNGYPSMQPRGSTHSGGARDLYPLSLIAVDKPAFLNLLRPPGIKLTPFSTNPSPDEFDSNHIGYVYNSMVVPDEMGNPPLMAERCVEDGMFTPGEEPVHKDRAHILMANGTVRKVPVKNGKLILGDIKIEDLEKLK